MYGNIPADFQNIRNKIQKIYDFLKVRNLSTSWFYTNSKYFE